MRSVNMMLLSLVVFVLLSYGASSLDITVGLTPCNDCSKATYYVAESRNATETIRRALLNVANSGGGSVYLLNGTYTINRPLEVFDNTQLIGAGIDVTIIYLDNFIDRFRHPTIMGVIRASTNHTGYGCDNITISKFTIDGNKVNQYQDSRTSYGRYGIYTENCNNMYVSEVHVQNMQHYGFSIQGTDESSVTKNLIIENCITSNNGWDGYEIEKINTVSIINCTAYNNMRHGFNLAGVKLAYLSKITTQNNGWEYSVGVGCGINIQNNITKNQNTDNVVVNDALLSNDSRAGVCMVSNVSQVILDKIRIDAPDTCIMLGNGTYNVYVSNNFCNSNKKKFITRTEQASNITSSNNTLSWGLQSSPNSNTKNSGVSNEPSWIKWFMIMFVVVCLA